MRTGKSDYKIIRVTPTLSTDAYAVGDVAFVATEIPNAVIGNGGCSKIVNAFLMDQDRDAYILQTIFTEGNTAIGTINATANITDADMEAIGLCGVSFFQYDTASTTHIDQVTVIKMQSLSGASESVEPMYIQAADDSTSVFLGMVADQSAVTFDATDSLQVILHIER